MPKERVRHGGNNSWADLLVRWDRENSTLPPTAGAENCRVQLFVAPLDLPGRGGSFMFTPEHPENFGMELGGSMGPITIDLDRGGINRLIRVLREARNQAYGRDE